jgi:hypothetical protein
MLLGPATMDGPRHIRWNVVSSRKERIDQTKKEWRAGRFGTIPGDTEELSRCPAEAWCLMGA